MLEQAAAPESLSPAAANGTILASSFPSELTSTSPIASPGTAQGPVGSDKGRGESAEVEDGVATAGAVTEDEAPVEVGDDGGATTAGVRDGVPSAEVGDGAVTTGSAGAEAVKVGADFRGGSEPAIAPPFSFLSLHAGGVGSEQEEARGAGVAAAGRGWSEGRSLEHMPEQPGSDGRGGQQTGRRRRRRGGDSGSERG